MNLNPPELQVLQEGFYRVFICKMKKRDAMPVELCACDTQLKKVTQVQIRRRLTLGPL